MYISPLLTVDYWMSADGPAWGDILECDRGTIRNYVLYGRKCGGFLESLLMGQMTPAYIRASALQRLRMAAYVEFLLAETPAVCQGSPQAYNDWVEIGGAAGMRSMWGERDMA